MGDVTRILSQIEQGDGQAAEQLLPLVYEELRKLAAQKMAQEKPGQTLQATALVHEAYIRLVDVEKTQHWGSRGHFFSAAAEAMRRILVESDRRKKTLQRGGNLQRQDGSILQLAQAESLDQIVAIDEALHKLGCEKPKVAKLVELRYFGGLTLDEAAAALGVSPRTADSYWAYAKAWLLQEMRDGASC